jgi:hypothetical protein
MSPSISSRLQTVAPGAKPRAGSIVTTPPVTKKPVSPAITTKKNPA